MRRLGACTGLNDTLYQIVHGVVETLDFGVAVINVVTTNGDLRVDAAAGPAEVTQMLGSLTPRHLWDRLLEHCEPLGSLSYLDHRRDPELVEGIVSWSAAPAPITDPDGWDPQDALFAPLLAHDGTLLGVLSVDCPRSGKHPDVEQRTLLELFAAEAAMAISDALRQAALSDRELLFRTVFDGAPAPMAVADAAGVVLRANEAFANLAGQLPDALIGRPLAGLVLPADRPAVLEAGRAVLAGAGQVSMEHRLPQPDGSVRWAHSSLTRIDTANSGVRLVIKVEDVTESRHALDELRYLADHDLLTGLPNRRAALQHLDTLLATPSDRTVTLLFCDLDGFKPVNDQLGHRAGDELLVHVARRLSAVVRPEELLCRLGGDEFVVVCALSDPAMHAPAIADRCIAALHEPFTVAGSRVEVSLSVGIASATGPTRDATALLAAADIALYGAKESGGARWHRMEVPDFPPTT